MKKRILSALLAIAILSSSLLGLVSCGGKYEPVESTAEEKATVMTLSFNSVEYKVPYELYRAFFLQLRSAVDGGDSSVWSGENKDEYVKKIDGMILDRISEIYAVFYLCEKEDIDVYSKAVDDEIEDFITVAVEGGSLYGEDYKGFDGDYDAYLASLREMYLNYSVQELLIRYSIAERMLYEHYIGTVEIDSENIVDGKLNFTRDDVEEFYFNSDACRRMIRTVLSTDAFTRERAIEIRDSISELDSAEKVVGYIINFTTSGISEIKNGEVVGKYSLDRFYYSEITDSLFSLSVGEVGEVILINTAAGDKYNIVYRIEPTDEHFAECYEEIKSVFLDDVVGKRIHDAAQSLTELVKYSDTLTELDRSTVSMKG